MRIALGRCRECDRLVYDDEGKVSFWFFDHTRACRDCVEAQVEKDLREIERREQREEASKEIH